MKGSPAMESLMWPFLTYVLNQRLQGDGERAAYARALDVHKGTVTRMLDGDTGGSRYMEHRVRVAAQVLGCSPIDIWREALDAWNADPDGDKLKEYRRQLRRKRETTRRGLEAVRRQRDA